MIYINQSLSIAIVDLNNLQNLQLLVNNGINYQDQVRISKQKWKSKPKPLFDRIRIALEVTCPGAKRCAYCEDSLADEIEHIRPKSWFPDQTFDPDNYLFACGPCNGPKNNSYGIVDVAGILTEAYRQRKAPVLPPPIGQEALINPRLENPADFFFLDIENTFEFKPHNYLSVQNFKRAAYTIDTLRLNKDPLVKARKEAFIDFVCRLRNYQRSMINNKPQVKLDRMRFEILQKQHITVWREMQRQSSSKVFLKSLFDLVPGSTLW